MKSFVVIFLVLAMTACSHAPPRLPKPDGQRVPINAPAAASSTATPATTFHKGD